VHRGHTARIVVRAPPQAACVVEIHYSDGALQQTGIKTAQYGRIVWTVRIPSGAALGIAHWTVRCGISWQHPGSWRVRP
jgi:hypothetical protein